jgi:acid phosphatase family membrane protein YuiD
MLIISCKEGDFMIMNFLMNQILISVFIASLVCLVWKVVGNTVLNKRFEWGYFIDTGGMPSSHSTFVCAIAMSIGFVEGFTSSVFLLSLGFAIIVVRDAFGVRRAVDRLNITVNRIIKEKRLGMEQIFEIAGHTPVQAMIGALLGVVIPVLLELFLYT